MVAGQKWVDLNPSKTLNLDTLAAFAADTYIGWVCRDGQTFGGADINYF